MPHLSSLELGRGWHESKSQELRCFTDDRVILHAIVASLVSTCHVIRRENVLPRYSNNFAAMDIVCDELEISKQTVESEFSAHITLPSFRRCCHV